MNHRDQRGSFVEIAARAIGFEFHQRREILPRGRAAHEFDLRYVEAQQILQRYIHAALLGILAHIAE